MAATGVRRLATKKTGKHPAARRGELGTRKLKDTEVLERLNREATREPKREGEPPHWKPYPHLEKVMQWDWKSGKVRMHAGWPYRDTSERLLDLVGAQNRLRRRLQGGPFEGMIPAAIPEGEYLVADAPTKGVPYWELAPELREAARNRIKEFVEATQPKSAVSLSTNPNKYMFYTGTFPIELAGVIGSPFRASGEASE